jgi:hypothetical protein
MTAHLALAVVLVVAINLSLVRRRPRHRARGGRRRHSLLYATYLHSPLWRLRRRIWIAQACGRCEQCGRRWRQLTIHHLTYTRLGHERRGDVRVLCWPCHSSRHHP